MENKDIQRALSTAGSIIGTGILAGLAGTAAITLSQMIEMRINKREASDSPVKVAGQVLGVEPSGEKEEVREEHAGRFGNIVHWGYGTSWGIIRGLIAAAGLKGMPATAAHFGAIWGTELVMLPAADAAQPVYKWEPSQVAVDVLHHGVYALAAGLAYEFISGGDGQA